MIRPIIKDQLNKCQFAKIPTENEQQTYFEIKKYSKPTYELNHCYLIKLPLGLVNNPNSVLATNWNQGSFPQSTYLKICVSKILGEMIYVDSINYDMNTKQDLNILWSGWLNSSELTQICAL